MDKINIDFSSMGVSINGGPRVSIGAVVITENGVEMGDSASLTDMKEKTLALARKVQQGQIKTQERITEV